MEAPRRGADRIMTSNPLAGAALAALALITLPAGAHVTLEDPVALAGGGYKAVFKVGHGCGESATRQISVAIPAGVRGAHPMPKPGWQLDVQRDKLPAGVATQGQPAEDVVRVTWTARTPADALSSAFYDEFVLVARLPAQPGPLYWGVSQVCESGRADWTEVPQAGQKLSDLKSPAALLDVLPAAPGGAHHH